jgi:hypothetical protein
MTTDLTYAYILDRDSHAVAQLLWTTLTLALRSTRLPPPALCEVLSVVSAEGLGWALRQDAACWEALCGDAQMLAQWGAETQRRALVAALGPDHPDTEVLCPGT